MQYSVQMSSRMLAIAGLCVFLLCVLLFLLGIEIGKRVTEGETPAAAPAATTLTVPSQPHLPATPYVTQPSVTAPSVTAPSVRAPSVSVPAVPKP
jgi:hypothetical protein